MSSSKTIHVSLMEARGDVISLIIDITKKILEIKLNESDDVFLELINNAIDELKIQVT